MSLTTLPIVKRIEVAARGEECGSLESNIEFKKKKVENRVKERHGRELHWQFFRQPERAASIRPRCSLN